MVGYSTVIKKLSSAGYKSRLWQRAEVRELCNVLRDDEEIMQATNGHYEGGFCLMVATNIRLLLVDKKPMFLTLDSIAYYMIQEVTYDYRLLNSSIHIHTTSKCLDFNSWNHRQIREIFNHTQQKLRVDRQQAVDAEPAYNQTPQNQPTEPIYMNYEYSSNSLQNNDYNHIPDMPYSKTVQLVNQSSRTQNASSPSNLPGYQVDPKNLFMKRRLSDYRPDNLTGKFYQRQIP